MLLDEEGCFEMCRFKLAWWIKDELGELVSSVYDMVWCLDEIEVPRKHKVRRGNWVWTCLTTGFIKINMDVLFLGSSGKGGVGGVFRDSEGKVLVQFGKEAQVDSIVHVELLVFREGMFIATVFWWFSIHSFVFESNFKYVISWVLNPRTFLGTSIIFWASVVCFRI